MKQDCSLVLVDLVSFMGVDWSGFDLVWPCASSGTRPAVSKLSRSHLMSVHPPGSISECSVALTKPSLSSQAPTFFFFLFSFFTIFVFCIVAIVSPAYV